LDFIAPDLDFVALSLDIVAPDLDFVAPDLEKLTALPGASPRLNWGSRRLRAPAASGRAPAAAQGRLWEKWPPPTVCVPPATLAVWALLTVVTVLAVRLEVVEPFRFPPLPVMPPGP
jgi:hypothetical protein